MGKNVIFLCFTLLMVITFFSGCTDTQIPFPSGTPPASNTEYSTVLVTPTPSPQIVYDTGTVPVTKPVTSHKTLYKAVEQTPATIRLTGNVYGIASTSSPSAGIDRIRFSIGLAPYSPPIDLTNMKIVFSTVSTQPKILTWDTYASTDSFSTKLGLNSVISLNVNDPIEITFETAQVPANTKIFIELRPESGAPFAFSNTTPETIYATNVLQ